MFFHSHQPSAPFQPILQIERLQRQFSAKSFFKAREKGQNGEKRPKIVLVVNHHKKAKISDNRWNNLGRSRCNQKREQRRLENIVRRNVAPSGSSFRRSVGFWQEKISASHRAHNVHPSCRVQRRANPSHLCPGVGGQPGTEIISRWAFVCLQCKQSVESEGCSKITFFCKI